MNTCSFALHFKRISVSSKVFVECITCYGELEEASSSSSSFQSTPLTSKVSLNPVKVNRACIESF